MSRPLPALAVAVLFLWSFLASAQSDTATISGRVTDQAGDVLVGAHVNTTNVETGIGVSTLTNIEGVYVVPLLRPGPYRIVVEKEGFLKIILSDLTLNVQDAVGRNFTMQVGPVNESITVTAGEEFNLSPAVSTLVDRQFVENLPLNGRSFQSLILLTPGVTVTTVSPWEFGQFSVNGQRPSTNSFAVDGVSANFGVSNNVGGATTAALAGEYPALSASGGTNNLISIDSLQEYRIQTSSYTAESGRQLGGQISVVTRSGTNSFHGTLFEYLRNDAMDARDYFNFEPAPKPALRQNNFGGTFSGPTFKDKTFFFFSYEGQRLRLPVNGEMDVPSMALRSQATGAALAVLNSFPKPNGPVLSANFAAYDYGISNPGTLDALSIRIDHTVNSRLTLFGRYNQASSASTVFFDVFTDGNKNVAYTKTLTMGATAMFTPHITNEFRFNYSRQTGLNQNAATTAGGAVPLDPKLLTSGLGGLGALFFFFNDGTASQLLGDNVKNYQRQINLVDSISMTRGAHHLKFGIDYRRLSPILNALDEESISFFSPDSLLNESADWVEVTSRMPAHPVYTNWSFYGQDTWKVNPRLTLDLGLRWELNPAPSVPSSEMPPVVLGVVGLDVSHATLAPKGTPFYKTFYTAFAPRVGVAYQLFRTPGHETVLRGGFGVYYDMGSGATGANFPMMAVNDVFGVPFPVSATDAARPVVSIPTSLPVNIQLATSPQDLKLPFTLQWNVALEQAFGTQQSVSLSYVASNGRRLLTTQILNAQASFNKPPQNPNFSEIVYTWNAPTSSYNSLQVQYRARLKRGLQALVNYTWSHSLDDVSTDLVFGTFTRGNSSFDVRHNFSAAITYNLPTFRSSHAIRQIFGGWAVDGVVHAQTGQPLGVVSNASCLNGEYIFVRPDLVRGQPLYLSDPTVPGGRRFNSAAFTSPPLDPVTGFPTRQGTFGRNVLRELPISQADFALGRTFSVREHLKVQFKGEVFNILNHPLFGNYATETFSSRFGVPSTTLRYSLSRSGNGLNALYQMGGPRSIQLSLRLRF